MDDIDRKLLILIGTDPRMHYRELAKRIGISRQAVHHRIQVLTELGVLKSSLVDISFSYLDGIPIAVFGRSRSAVTKEILDRLGENDQTRRVVLAGGNYAYIVGFLREISDLGDYVDFVTRTSEMSEPTVVIYSLDDGLSPNYYVDGGRSVRRSHRRELTPLDMKIVASLKDDVRRPTAEIASMLRISPKTVRRHLDAMMAEGLIDFSTPQDLQSGGDMFLLMHVSLKDGVDKIKFGKSLLSGHGIMDSYVRSFTNVPNLLVWVFWSDSIAKVRNALKEISENKNVVAVMLNFAYYERIYSTWRDKMPELGTRYSGRRRTRNPRTHSRTR